MKINVSKLLSAAVLLGAMASVTVACKSKKGKPIEKQTGAIEISVPFSGKEFQTDKEVFRATASGLSIDMMTAKKIAVQNAKAEIAGMVKSLVSSVTRSYVGQAQIQNSQEFKSDFENMINESVKENLVGVAIIGEKIFKESDNKFTYWIAIEINKKSLLDGITDQITKDQKLSLNYDKKKFEEIFNSEMDKLSKERAGQ